MSVEKAGRQGPETCKVPILLFLLMIQSAIKHVSRKSSSTPGRTHGAGPPSSWSQPQLSMSSLRLSPRGSPDPTEPWPRSSGEPKRKLAVPVLERRALPFPAQSISQPYRLLHFFCISLQPGPYMSTTRSVAGHVVKSRIFKGLHVRLTSSRRRANG